MLDTNNKVPMPKLYPPFVFWIHFSICPYRFLLSPKIPSENLQFYKRTSPIFKGSCRILVYGSGADYGIEAALCGCPECTKVCKLSNLNLLQYHQRRLREGAGFGYGGFATSTAAILVLFILLVIISRTILGY
jgi:hypothetical protein